MADYIIDGNGVSCLVILGYAPIIKKVKTSLLGPTKLLIALKNI